jgi:hypothetical protein
MARLLSAAALVLLLAAPALAAGGRLVVRDRRAGGGDVDVVWTLPSGPVAISKGTGTDPAAIAATLHLRAEGTAGELVAPQGAWDGVSGWTLTPVRARYHDTAPDPAVRVAVVREAKKIRLVGGNPGDPLLAVLASGAPSGPVTVALRVENGGTIDHCVAYPSCTHHALAGGGFKLVCGDPVADASCAAIPVPGVCGNGIRDVGESCDGGTYCGGSCQFPSLSPGCCQAESTCRDATGFILYFHLMSFCSPDTPVRGGLCSAGGTCDIQPLQPVPLCCQLSGSCNEDTANDTQDLWSFRNVCVGAMGGTPQPAATCGPTGTCEPG